MNICTYEYPQELIKKLYEVTYSQGTKDDPSQTITRRSKSNSYAYLMTRAADTTYDVQFGDFISVLTEKARYEFVCADVPDDQSKKVVLLLMRTDKRH